MKRIEIEELIDIYEKRGVEQLVTKLYQIKKEYKEIELASLLEAYLHLTNKNNNSYYYTSDKEQIITNNTGSVIYFNKKLFDFKNINNRKIVTKESFQVSEDEMMEILSTFKVLCGSKVTHTNDIDFVNDKIIVTTKYNSAEFNKREFELIAKLLDYPTFNLSDQKPSIYMQSDKGYAYILGKKM